MCLILKFTVFISSLIFTSPAEATNSADPLAFSKLVINRGQSNQPPRGPDILAIAGHCGVGPFGQTGNVGVYEPFCTQLTEAEICFAYVRGHIQPDGQVHKVYDQAKAHFCAQKLLSELTSEYNVHLSKKRTEL